MKRDLKKLSDSEFDVLVVGAGIYGVATAWDAALRGLKVALIEKKDFGSATSANSLKIIHGGLRYLQTLDIKRMRESIHERMVLMRIAPHLVYPMPVIMPTYANRLKSRPAMFAALLANDMVGFDRNGLSDPHKYMPNGHLISIAEVQKHIPGYTKYNMSGGALWYDCQCYNTERFSLSFVLSAVKKEAVVANYVKADDLIKKGNRIIGVKAKDELSGDSFDIRAKVVVNNSGPWVDHVLDRLNGQVSASRFTLSTAMNLVINRKLLGKHAAGLSGPYHYVRDDGSEYNSFRMLFFAPWRDYTIIGTNHLPYSGKQDDYKVTEAEITDFLATVNKAYSAAEIKREEVSYFYGGFLPMAQRNPDTGEVQLQKHYGLHDHQVENQVEGLISVVGVKYTTARDVARKTIDTVFKKLQQSSPKCLTEERALQGGNIMHFENFVNDAISSNAELLSEKVMRHLCHNYGSGYNEILAYGKQRADLLKMMPDSKEVIKAEIVHGVQEEMALKLSDLILRRTDLGAAGNPGEACLKEAAQIMGKELNWDAARRQQEIDAVKNIYIPA